MRPVLKEENFIGCNINAFYAADECRQHVKNIKMIEFGDYIWNHHEKCIQMSTNMLGICLDICEMLRILKKTTRFRMDGETYGRMQSINTTSEDWRPAMSLYPFLALNLFKNYRQREFCFQCQDEIIQMPIMLVGFSGFNDTFDSICFLLNTRFIPLAYWIGWLTVVLLLFKL